MANGPKSLAEAIRQRRATPSFDGQLIPPGDLRQILEAGLHAPSGYNMQPWRFIVVQHPEQRSRLRAASYNQAKVEEASAVIVACGDRDGWRRDLDEMLRMGRLPAACRRATLPKRRPAFPPTSPALRTTR